MGRPPINEVFLKNPSYTLLRKSIVEDVAPLVLIVGSGISKSAGYPDWKGLRARITESLEDFVVSQIDADPKFDDAPIELLKNDLDYWSFFRGAKRHLGAATFNGLIEQILDKNNSRSKSLEILLELDPKGLVTLNLDKTAGESFNKIKSNLVVPIDGFEISQKWQFITDEKSFLIYLHGHIKNPSSWVLGRDQLDALMATGSHSRFLSSLFLHHTVLFVGVSADDLSVSYPLLTLRNEGILPRRVFWLTSRNDHHTRQWAEESHVQVINYSASTDAEHDLKLRLLVDDIKSFSSDDSSKIPPLANYSILFNPNFVYIDPQELSLKDPEFIRVYLSQYLSDILSTAPDIEHYDKFYEVLREYDFAIRTRSFYRSNNPAHDKFFGYKLNFPELGEGNFGTVYQAFDTNGKNVAVKIMRDNILNASEMIGGFRRGTRSMKILTDNNVQGVVPLLRYFEMPPAIVMEHVPGNSLQELFGMMPSIPWKTKISIVSDVVEIVNSCHLLKQNVLHRDLKPSNIMVSDLDYDDFSYSKVTVLDFDMSWHKGSNEKDVVFESRDDFGYLAPEQTDSAANQSTRSTKVDSFGLGMTAYALLAGKHPIPNVSMTEGWYRLIEVACRSNYKSQYQCLPKRMARLIFDATRSDQNERLLFSAALSRLQKMNALIHDRGGLWPIDLLAEEFLAAISSNRKYLWDDVADKGSLEIAGGVKVLVSVDERSNGIRVNLVYQDNGGSSYQKRRNFIQQCANVIGELSKTNTCKVEQVSKKIDEIDAMLVITKCSDYDGISDVTQMIKRAMDYLLQITR